MKELEQMRIQHKVEAKVEAKVERVQALID